jgi:putative FmdB family regulatory protein
VTDVQYPRSAAIEVDMPIYEYRCSSCGTEFEKLVRASDVPECPSCNGHKLDKKLSVFATSSQEPTGGGLPDACASCGNPGGPGSCMMH